MARGRFISATLGGSRKFARLANDTHRMIYMLLIPSVDAYGRIDADPVTLCGRVLTRLGIAPDDANTALADMHQVGLIHLYQVGEDQFAEIVDFHEHNDIDLSREAQAVIPDARGVMPPEKPPRGTKKAEADPRAWSADYVAANVVAEAEQGSTAPVPVEPAPPRAAPALAGGGHVPHTADTRQSNPSASRVEVEVEVEVEALKPLSVSKPESPATEPPAAKPRSLTLKDLIRIWNQERGQLVQCRSDKDPQLQRLGKAFLQRYKNEPDGGEEMFRAGIANVREDPTWLRNRAPKPTGDRAHLPPLALVNYLRHVDTKAEAALDAAENTQNAPPDPLAQYRERGL